MKKTIVIAHGNCPDGFTSAWLLWNMFRDDAEYVHAQYGDAPPDVDGRVVFIVDFSYPRDVMESIFARALRVVVLDHHKTAEAALVGVKHGQNVFIVFDMNRSGAGLTWDYLHPLNPRPTLVNYVEDHDLWRKALPESDAYSSYLKSQPMTFESWTAVMRTDFDEIVKLGKASLALQDRLEALGAATARREMISGHFVPTASVQYALASGTASKMLDLFPNSEFAAGYFRRGDGVWQFSLRSRPGFDVSVIAKRFGGGGHAQAAGFELHTLPF